MYCSALTLNMKCVGSLETSARNFQPTLRNTQKSGALNYTATKALNMPSVEQAHSKKYGHLHRYSRKVVDGILLNLMKRKNVRLVRS